MNSALDEINRDIEQLQKLRELASDPRMFSLMAKIVNASGAAPMSSGLSADRVPSLPVIDGSFGSVQPGLTEAVAKEVCAYPQGATFTHNDIHDAMIRKGYRFTAKQPRTAVSGALRRFAEKPQTYGLESVGSGRSGATVYRRQMATGYVDATEPVTGVMVDDLKD